MLLRNRGVQASPHVFGGNWKTRAIVMKFQYITIVWVRFRLGSPTKHVILLVVTGILGGGDNPNHSREMSPETKKLETSISIKL